MIFNKNDKSIKEAVTYSIIVHASLFLVMLWSAFWSKKEPQLLTDIEITGEGEFREAMEKARSGITDTDSSRIEEEQETIQRRQEQHNQKNQQEKNMPEMVDELEIPEETLPEPLSQTAIEQPAKSIPSPVVSAEETYTGPEAALETGQTEQSEPKIVPIETPNDVEKNNKKKADKKPQEEAALEKKNDKKKKRQQKKVKQPAERRKRKLETAIKHVEKVQKKKKIRQKVLDIAEKAALKKSTAIEGEKRRTLGSSPKTSAEDRNLEGSGRGDKGSGMGVSGIGTAPVEGDYELISSQIYPYWVVPSGVRDAENIVIEIHIELGDNGEVIPSSIKILDEKKYTTDQVFRAAADSARRAIIQASPLSIPREKLEAFRSITLRFNLGEALAE